MCGCDSESGLSAVIEIAVVQFVVVVVIQTFKVGFVELSNYCVN